MAKSTKVVTTHPAAIRLSDAEARAKIDQINQYVVRSLTFALSTNERKKLWLPEQCHQRRIIYPGMKQSDVINAYRDIRTKIVKKSDGAGAIVAVTSLGDKNDHNPLVPFNLATSFALDESKTAIFIDCDPYTNDQEELAIRDMQFGLTDYLTNANVSLADITYPSGIDRLKIIPTGGATESAAEHYNHPKMDVIVSSIKCSLPNAFVILNTPPVLHYSETAIIADKADMVVLVVPAKKATQGDIDNAIGTIGEEKVAGVVLNS